MWEPSQATLDIGFLRPLWWKGRRRVRSRCESPKVPSGQRSILPSMMRVNSMETWMKPLPLQGFPAKALLFGVGITNKRQGDYVRAMKREPSDAS